MDNVFYSKGCPAKMSDGRQYTDWNPHGGQDLFFMEKMNVKSEHEYRRKLQENAEEFIRKQTIYFVNNSTCKCNERSCTLKQ